jgi:O-antigen/teichoic acid export membrane protein
LFPAFAKLDTQNDDELVKTVFASSIKYTSLLLIPVTMAMMALSSPIIATLYGEKYIYGPFFLTIAVIGNLFAAVGNLSAGSLLSGLGETRILMIQSIITLIIGLPLGFILIPTLGITGLIIANTVSGVPSMLWGLHWIWKHYKAKADLKSSTKILAASAISATIAFLILNFIAYAYWIELIAGGAIFLASYLITAPIIGAINQSDIKNLKTMFSGLGIISKLLNVTLTLMEKLSKTNNNS